MSQKKTKRKINCNTILARFIWKNTLELLIKLAQQHPRNNGKHIKRTTTWNADIHTRHSHFQATLQALLYQICNKNLFCQIMVETNIET